MKLIVGLGNPGRIYTNSKHNIGFSCIKLLSKIHGVSLKREKGISSLTAKLDLYNKKVILAVPLTFMNLSGSAVKGLMNRYHLDAADILVICDDMDLPFGKIRIRPKGSSGGHRGIKSVIEDIRTKDFSRLRIGVGRPDNRMEAAEYVLSNFNKKEAPSLKKILLTAVECCEMWVNKGVVEAMNNFNAKEQGNE